MSAHPALYEINTRVWRHRFRPHSKLLAIPDAYWAQLAKVGIDIVWLMGVWKTGPNVLHYALEPGLQDAYRRALPDWQSEDIIGSPYAIDHYELQPELGQPDDLKALRERLRRHGLRLMLDFVPNHFHAESSLLAERPEIFLEVGPGLHASDPHTFFESTELPGRFFAHGKDPNFPAWQDTVQLNYAAPAARAFMQEQLLALADCCDGLRCDMAMLMQPAVFARTWGSVVGPTAGQWPPFWPDAIRQVKARHPDFTFLAEVYWDMEWELQQAGFDYTYDKRLLDRLLSGPAESVANHLRADHGFQQHSARFLENHDEERILHLLDERRAQAAAIITYTIPGLRFFHEGQWEGLRLRLPVQLGRAMREPACSCAAGRWLPVDTLSVNLPDSSIHCACGAAFYDQLLNLLREPLFRLGQWRQFDNSGQQGLLIWHWKHKEDEALVVVNYQDRPQQVLLPLGEGIWLEAFSRQTHDLREKPGLGLSLSPWQYAIYCR
ncbi:MAG: hypothetical protein KDC54_04165 [Lewinella sp.]|nr:hypothetical protein [Lewinella sp.]